MPMQSEARQAGFGTFAGVYRPIVLTVLGAMLYLREGWLVGNAGLGGALLVIGAAFLITGTTALSLSSIATNLRLRAGGAFAIIAAALGLEAGGAIGVPLFIAQTVSSAMYLFAFAEGWGYIFPTHDPRIVAGVAFASVAAVVLRSASLASRAQAVMLWVVAVAILSALGGWWDARPQPLVIIGRFPEASLLECFALFFPAATGIMVGAGMSGELASPSRSVPRGTMFAWGTTLAVYVIGAIWYATVIPREELLTNKLAMVDHAAVGEMVLFGLLSSTLMAAMSSLVAAPRLLQAMAAHDVVPGAGWLQQQTENGEPRNATIVTLLIAASGLLAGSLDAIAPVITSFFVMTYLAVNVVVFLEQGLGLVSWRPTFLVPTWVPALGASACLLGLVLSSPAGGLPEVMFVTGIYLWLARRKRVDTPWETVQSGIAQTLAAWAARKAAQMRKSPRTWKPDLLVPVASEDELRSVAPAAEALIASQGSVKFVALKDGFEEPMDELVEAMRERARFCSWHLMPEETPAQGARLSISAMQGTFFAPNLVLLSARHTSDAVAQVVLDHAVKHQVGVVLLFDSPELPLTKAAQAAVWLSDRSPDWELALRVTNLDLPVLLAYLLTRPDSGSTRLCTVLRGDGPTEPAKQFLDDLVQLGRLPRTTSHVLRGSLLDQLRNGPPADVHLFGLPPTIELERLWEIHRAAGAPCVFVRDSGQESALA
ncbi:MAG: solute carrier family 12 sodium/potassium/chloride transporter 2 [Myxococcota bacterium]|jgi:solute carrier family 12 sodium/potassium/chloride transporter 2